MKNAQLKLTTASIAFIVVSTILNEELYKYVQYYSQSKIDHYFVCLYSSAIAILVSIIGRLVNIKTYQIQILLVAIAFGSLIEIMVSI